MSEPLTWFGVCYEHGRGRERTAVAYAIDVYASERRAFLADHRGRGAWELIGEFPTYDQAWAACLAELVARAARAQGRLN